MKRNRILITSAFIFVFIASFVFNADASKDTMSAYTHKDTPTMEQLSNDVAASLGKDWHVKTEFIEVPGDREVRIGCAVSTFTNNSLRVNDTPSVFRIMRTNWPTPILSNSNSESDVAFSYKNFSYWYYNPGTFGKTYPAKWNDVLKKLHTLYELPVATNSLVCWLEKHEDIYPVGVPVNINLFIKELPGFKNDIMNQVDHHVEFLVVTDPSGKRLPYRRLPGRPQGYGRTGSSFQNLERDFALNKSGIYKLKMRCPFGKDSNEFLESPEISMQVVPTDFIKLQLTRLVKEDSLAPGGTMPVELIVKVKKGGISQFSQLKILYSARQLLRFYEKLYGSPHRWDMFVDIMESLHPDGKGIYKMQFDLAAGSWNGGGSSVGPSYPITKITKPGQTWWAKIYIYGMLDGRRFRISSNEVSLKMK